MFCTNCGKEVKTGFQFCPFCGKNINMIAISQNQNEKNIDNSVKNKEKTETTPSERGNRKVEGGVRIGISVVFIIINFIVFVLSLNQLLAFAAENKNVVNYFMLDVYMENPLWTTVLFISFFVIVSLNLLLSSGIKRIILLPSTEGEIKKNRKIGGAIGVINSFYLSFWGFINLMIVHRYVRYWSRRETWYWLNSVKKAMNFDVKLLESISIILLILGAIVFIISVIKLLKK